MICISEVGDFEMKKLLLGFLIVIFITVGFNILYTVEAWWHWFGLIAAGVLGWIVAKGIEVLE